MGRAGVTCLLLSITMSTYLVLDVEGQNSTRNLTHEMRNHSYIFYLIDHQNFTNAKKACENAGSRLVEIYDNETDVFLRSYMVSGEEWFLTGGKNPNGTEVIWDSGAPTTFVGWYVNEQLQLSQDCVAIQDNGWIDDPCSNADRYICESMPVRNPQISPSSASVTLSESSVKQVTCKADGIPVPSVQWTLGSGRKVIEGNQTKRIHQTTSNGQSILNLGYAKLADEGTYTCLAQNSPGGVNKSSQAAFQLKVPGRVTFLTMNRVSCSAKVTVKWKPSQYAAQIPHKIIFSITGSESVKHHKEFMTSNTTAVQSFEKLLLPWTSYTISVTPCPRNICMSHYIVSNLSVARTEGTPGLVKDFFVEESIAKCVLKWEKPEIVPQRFISHYKIFVNQSVGLVNISSNNASMQEFNVTGNITNYVFRGKPNTEYWIGVRAQTCAGYGPIVWSKMSCVPRSQEKDWHKGWIAGVVIGVLMFIALMIIIVLFLRKRSKKKDAEI